MLRSTLSVLLGCIAVSAFAAEKDAVPLAPPGFEVTLFAKEPLVRNPCSMAFDARGRLFVGMGPQFRMPKPDTPGDSVVIVLDTDGDGRADQTKVFATGFNCVQSLAWRGRDLWVANSPDLTIVRDLDGDDEADEYVRVYTDLGNLEHGLHGLNWAPDGKLYMSKGNSKGLTQPGRLAPKAFRELWGVKAAEGSPDMPPPVTYKKGEYRHAYHDPADDWGREGGVLRCDPSGGNLEIISRGFRNPWDITCDSGFNWLGTDNDQTTGDRVFTPFFGAHFGWNHSWSSHWSDEPHAPTAPVSGPLFEGSGTGIVWVDHPQFPPEFRGVFLINDWLRKTTFVWRPEWDGALLRPKGGNWEPFLQKGISLFNPTDMEIGPDGALWCLSWGNGYGANLNKDGSFDNEGRIYRIAWKDAPPLPVRAAKEKKGLAEWTVKELVDDFAGPLPVWRTDAQVELVRRGDSALWALYAASRRELSQTQETWLLWTLAQIGLTHRPLSSLFEQMIVEEKGGSLNVRIQAARISVYRAMQLPGRPVLAAAVLHLLEDSEPRLRMAAAEAIARSRDRGAMGKLVVLLAGEKDPTVYYAAWQALRQSADEKELRDLLVDPRAGVRRGALLALLESGQFQRDQLGPLAGDADPGVREIIDLYNGKSTARPSVVRRSASSVTDGGASDHNGSAGPSLIRKVASRGNREYRSVPGGLRPGAKVYSDRDYVVKEVPPQLLGADFLQTANDDDGSKGDDWLTFEALFPVRVYVGIDKRSTHTPRWVREGFKPSGAQIAADHWTFELYAREFPAGPIELGGNTDDGRGGGKGNYTVIFELLPLPQSKGPPALAASLALVEKGDAARGAVLFSHRGGIGCVKCHRVGTGPSNSLAPDLSAIGHRAAPKHLVESILEPSAVITEGFRLHQVETTAGLVHSGILLEESGLSVALGLATGERLTILKEQIESRQFAAISAMPSFGPVLSEQQVADLAAFLLTQKASLAAPPPAKVAAPMTTPMVPSAAPAPMPAVVAGGDRGWAVEEREHRLFIQHDKQMVAEYHFRDARVKRPFLANLRLPSGAKVTRNHPPEAGDATDHDTMHPGLWLGFGDISGVDFWRNQGRIEHLQFLEPPAIEKESLRLSSESRLVGPGEKVLGRMTNRVSFHMRPGGYLVHWQATFHADDQELIFGDQEEMGFGARVATPLTEKATGLITSSTGLKTAAQTWGKGAAWCDYSGKIKGEPTGITLFSGPQNFREAWWHNRDYGVFVANPFGRAAMQQGAKSAVVVKKGESLRLDFGARLHAGADYDPKKAYEEFVGQVANLSKVK